ncbi:MAG: HipA domain-containing protein [Verrucomicrobiota bacterium]
MVAKHRLPRLWLPGPGIEPARFPGLATNEAWCLELARQLGLDAAHAWSILIGKTACLIVKRYDRQASDGNPPRCLHQEDFCQAMGFPPNRKYQQEGGPSLQDCFALIREWSSAPVLDILRLLDALILAVLPATRDAHATNLCSKMTEAIRHGQSPADARPGKAARQGSPANTSCPGPKESCGSSTRRADA